MKRIQLQTQNRNLSFTIQLKLKTYNKHENKIKKYLFKYLSCNQITNKIRFWITKFVYKK